jgi:hypothetical protein
MLWPIIRNPPVHVPPSLATTCQLQPVSRKAERNTISLLPHASKKTFRTGLPGKPVRANLLTMVWSDYIWPNRDVRERRKPTQTVIRGEMLE